MTLPQVSETLENAYFSNAITYSLFLDLERQKVAG